MNRLTAIGLASLAAYALLIGSKYAGFVSAAREDRMPAAVALAATDSAEQPPAIAPLEPLAQQQPAKMPPPVTRVQPMRASQVSLDFRATRDLTSFSDPLLARRETLTGDERFYLAKALEECQFATAINEDLVAYGAKQKRQFLSSLPAGDPLNAKRVAAYDAVDSSQRCLRFQGAKIATRDIEDLYRSAAMQGDPRAQSRMLVAELNKNLSAPRAESAAPAAMQVDDFSRIIGLLQSHDPEAILTVGQFLAQSATAQQLRIGPNGEYPEPQAFLGAFSLVACDMSPDCAPVARELQLACAYGGFCNAQSFEELYQNFVASPWTYTQALRYRGIIYNAIRTHDWSLIGLQPKAAYATEKPLAYSPKSSTLQQQKSTYQQNSLLLR
jgi:hypothetical protein